jgi:hypothetical protein
MTLTSSSASSNSSTRLSFHATASMRSLCCSVTRLRSSTLGSAAAHGRGGLLTGRTGWEDLEAARRIIVLTGMGESQETRTRRAFGLDEDRVTSGFGSVSRETGSGSVPAETGFGSEPTWLRFGDCEDPIVELQKLRTVHRTVHRF